MVTTRLRQGLTALTMRRKPVRLPDRYRQILDPPVVDHWNRLSPYDQHHLLDVADDLDTAGAAHHVVLAGLLHDIGKPAGTTMLTRSAAVLLRRFAPGLTGRLRAARRPLPGLRGVHRLLHHAETGADLLAQHHLAPDVVWLVRHHEHPLDDPDLITLQIADDRN